MLIYQLELENFKSYNGKHVLGPFDPHFTCVIGPNGNGKSNIIDAVLFVFGFKSAKLRQDSLAALIHRSAFAKPEQATVTVTFREDNVITSVSRSVLKSGHSSYRLNGERIGWTELREQLISKRIDLNKNLFIILQGQVERLCELSPQKMVEYLEYVSGSDEFKEAIDEAERKYIERSIVKEELRASVGVRRKVFESLGQRAGQQATWMLLRMKGLMLQHLVMKKIFLQNHKSYLQLKETEEQHVAACQRIQKDISEKEKQVKEKRDELKTVAAQCRKGEQYIEQIEQRLEKISLKVKEATRQINFALRDKECKQQGRDRLAAEVDELGQIEKQHKELEERSKAITAQLKKVKEVGKLKLCMELEEKLKQAHKQQASLTSKCSEDSKNLLEDRAKLAIYELKYKQNKETIIKRRAEIKQAREQINQLVTAIAENQELLQQIERQIIEKPNEKMINNQQKLINEVRSANKLKLICGETTLVTLRELLIVDAAYADVVETILPHLDYFIVQNLKQAKEVLDFLNKRKLGRMTLLIKESIREATLDLKEPTSCPKDTKLLYEVCKCTDQETKRILIWSLGNTLVTSKLETAMKVAYYDQKRYRVITTNGEFIDFSGTITKLPLKNGKDKEDSDLLQKKKATIKRVLASLAQRKAEMEAKEEEAERILLSVENQQRSLDGLDEVFLNQLEDELKENTSKLAALKCQISNLSENLEKIQAKLKTSGFKMQDYESMLLLVKEQAQTQQKMKKIANSHNLLASLNAKMKESDACISKLNEAVEQKVRQKNQLETDKLRLVQLIDNKRRELSVIQYGANLIEADIKEIETARKSLEDQLGDSNRKTTLSQPREELKRIRAKLRSAEMEKMELLNKLQESISEIKDFSFVICQTLSKRPELIPKEENEEQELNIGYLLGETALSLGKEEYKFLTFLNEKERGYLLEGSRVNGNLYFELCDIRPSDAQADLIFESLASKDVKFGHSFQMQKLRHFEKEINKGQPTAEFDLDFPLFEEYSQRKREFETQLDQLKIVSGQVEAVKEVLISLRNQRLDVFLKCFNEVNVELNRIYMRLTGGKAQMSLLDSMNPFEGVEFSVRPVNKSWKRVNLLSGGEKTFTSLALIFACEEIKQFPFYFMDEIDAALDYRNTTLLAQYITDKKHTQHIVISLRKNMYQESNRLVGVYKIKDQSRTVEIPMAALQEREHEEDEEKKE